MEIIELNKRPNTEQKSRLNRKYAQFEKLLNELKNKKIPDEIISTVNSDIEQINLIANSEKELRKQIRKTQSRILKLIEKELKLVTKNHYRNTWLAVGMVAFGLPLGAAFGASVGNTAFLAIGLPIGMVIGMVVGTAMDKKAKENEKQLDFEV